MGIRVSRCHRHRFRVEIISHCVWLYFSFPLSFHDVEEMLAMRGVSLSYETVREWCLKFGQTYANGLRHRSSRPGDRWHLDEVFLKINGRQHYLWRAVDQDGDVLDSGPAQAGQEGRKEVLSQALKGVAIRPTMIVTDKLKSCGAARNEVMPSVEHVQQKYQNNRAENSHQPPRLREKAMRGFKSSGHAQRFLSVFGIITSHFRVGRRLLRASSYRTIMKLRLGGW